MSIIHRPKITITLESARKALREAVVKRGADYIYRSPGHEPTCYYVHNDGQPGCIVGEVLVSHGMSPHDLLTQIGHAGNTQRFGALIKETQYSSLSRELGPVLTMTPGSLRDVVDIDPEALRLLTTVQTHQDRGMPWGAAVSQAEIAVSGRSVVFAREPSTEGLGGSQAPQGVPEDDQ